MKIFLVLSLAFAAALAAPQEVSPFITGGVNAIPGEFPFMVSIQHCFLGCDHICGGSVLAPLWVITAAHCFTETSTAGNIEAFIGRHNLGVNEAGSLRIRFESNRWIVHPGWIAGRNFGPNDIALVLFVVITKHDRAIIFSYQGRLLSTIQFNERIRPVRLPQQGSPQSGPGTLIGWGAVATGILERPVDILQKVMFSTIAHSVCHDAVLEFDRDATLIDNTKFCTGPLTGGKFCLSVINCVSYQLKLP